MDTTMTTYFAPNKTIRELHAMMKSGAGIDPLKDFSEIARRAGGVHLGIGLRFASTRLLACLREVVLR